MRYASTVLYSSIFAGKYGTLLRYVFFVMVRVRYGSKIELKYGTLVRYGSRCEVLSTQILNVPYRTATLDARCRMQIKLLGAENNPNPKKNNNKKI